VAESTPATADGSLRKVVLSVTSEVAQSFSVPGQYVKLRTSDEGKEAFIAVASAVGERASSLELLIKPAGGTTAAELCALLPGATLQASLVQGRGFQTAGLLSTVTEWLLFATGSGLSPIRSLLDTPVQHGGLAGGGYKVRLFLGIRSLAHAPFAARLDAWREAGVEVHVVCSEAGGGYVQEAAAAAGMVIDAQHTAAAVIGQKDMSTAVGALLATLGVPKERVLSNF